MINIKEINNKCENHFGYILSGGTDRAMLLKHFGYKHKQDFRPQANFYDNYDEDMVHCKWCEFIGENPIHPYSLIKSTKAFAECENLEIFRNSIRTNEELQDSVSGRIIEKLLEMHMRDTGQKTYTTIQVKESVKERYGNNCFLSNEPNPEIDHIFALDLGWPLTPKNACPLGKHKNSSKRATLPIDYFTPEQLEKLSKLSGYTLEELKTQTYNFTFWDWLDENWDKAVEYIDSRKVLKSSGGKEKVKTKLLKIITSTKQMRNNIDNI